MKNLLLLSLICFLPARLMAQDCLGMTLKPGMGYEMQSFSAKDKPNGRMIYVVKNVRKEGQNTVIDIEFQSLDEREKNRQPASQIKYTCTGDELIADLSGMVTGAGQAPENTEMKMKANKLQYPRTLAAGQKLPDGQLEADFYKSGSIFMAMTMQITNRLVGPNESLTTPAGTFAVNKVSADIDMKNRVMGIGIPVSLKSVSYRAGNTIFDVRTETYNKSGKLMGYSVLSKVH